MTRQRRTSLETLATQMKSHPGYLNGNFENQFFFSYGGYFYPYTTLSKHLTETGNYNSYFCLFMQVYILLIRRHISHEDANSIIPHYPYGESWIIQVFHLDD